MARRFGAPRGPRLKSTGSTLPKGKRTAVDKLAGPKMHAGKPSPGRSIKASGGQKVTGSPSKAPARGRKALAGPYPSDPKESSGDAKAFKGAPKPGQAKKALAAAKAPQFSPPKARKAPRVGKAPKEPKTLKAAARSGFSAAHGQPGPPHLSLVEHSPRSSRVPSKLKLKPSGPRSPKKLHPAFALHVRPPT